MGETEYKADTEQVERLSGAAEAAAADSVLGDDVGDGAGMGRPSFKWSAIRHYAITRFSDLVPTKEYMLANRELLNPFPAVAEIPGKQWRFILCGLAAWTWDSFDFFTVSLNVTQLHEDFDTSVSSITWGITLVLMLRTVGAIVFGYLGDKYGSKWPFVANLAIMCALQIGTGFIKTFHQFLGVRAIFGVVMGGIYGNATATALDDCPVRAKGFISGVLQQGYALGYLLAVIFTRALADTTSQKWRSMFWFASGVSFLITVSRIVLPQTDAYKKEVLEERIRKESGIVSESFEKKAAKVFKFFWPLLVYMVLLMAGFNFMSHGSQDLYPTFLKEQLGFSKNRSTVTNCVANLGAITGGIIVGHFSNFMGRRLSIIACVVLGGALIYPWAFVRNTGINAAVFFLQFGVQGAFGVVPIHLSELSAPAYEYRSFIVGVAYQLGNLASSASSTIESTLGNQFHTMGPEGKMMQDYGKVMAIFMGAVFAYVFFITFIGPENRAVTVNVHVAHEKEKEKENESLYEADKV
ncbi:Piso0_005587 [Millerozyma farinosa CBS 7064]|uniref:Piso0_005587 protein n=1 Tax=Pichia sorbitophila (strain ATCC MYA-4447 / BCRC 22081 / CBS 7064 / NBRC 10061 / NRRL Y-12695) TaxID=559304 RepID=G8XZE1_PICSO|nr:Piso0_005587 [Millerozyma farinosa CBS 7064]